MSKKIFLLTFLFALTVSLLGAWFYGREMTGKSESETEPGQYLDVQTLYYYDELRTLLEEVRAEEELGRFAVVCEENIPLFTGCDEPNVALGSNFGVFLNRSLGYPLAELATEWKANPFSYFNRLVAEEWVKPVVNNYFGYSAYPETDGVAFRIDGFTLYGAADSVYYTPQLQPETKYEYSEKGCEQFLCMVSALEGANQNAFRYVTDAYERDAYYSEADDCYYSFLINYDREAARILALYFRSDDGRYITDVTAQLLLVEFPWGDPAAGGGLAHELHRAEEEFGAFTLLMSIERALTGTSLYSEPFVMGREENSEAEYLTLPAQYSGRRYTAEADLKTYETDLEYPGQYPDSGDVFRLYTYSVKLK